MWLRIGTHGGLLWIRWWTAENFLTSWRKSRLWNRTVVRGNNLVLFSHLFVCIADMSFYLVKRITAFYGKPSFITVFTTVPRRTSSWARLIQSIFSTLPLSKRRFWSTRPSILCYFNSLLPCRIRDQNLIGYTHSPIFCRVYASALIFLGARGGLISVILLIRSQQYEGWSKIFRTDAVKIIKLTIRPVGCCHPWISSLPHVDTGHTISSIFGMLLGSPFLPECQTLSAIRLVSNQHPFSFNFIFGNRKKSQGAKLGEYGG
jgi:hypothetical protein